jgi:hypothetical protein
MPKVQKFVSFSISCFISFVTFSQVTNFDFVQPLPPNGTSILSIPPKITGTYENEKGNQIITVKTRGIYLESTVYGSISKEDVREKSEYDVRNGYLFGVFENDSIPCVLDKETYYFGYRKTTEVFSFNGESSLRKSDSDKLDQTYILCYKENGYWVPLILRFTTSKLTLSSPSFDEVEEAFDEITDKFQEVEESITFVHLHPTADEWKKIDLQRYFKHKSVYIKQ